MSGHWTPTLCCREIGSLSVTESESTCHRVKSCDKDSDSDNDARRVTGQWTVMYDQVKVICISTEGGLVCIHVRSLWMMPIFQMRPR